MIAFFEFFNIPWRSHTRNFILSVSVTLTMGLASLSMLTGCSAVSNESVDIDYEATPDVLTIGIIADGTASTDLKFIEDMKSQITNKVAGHIPTLPAELKNGVPGKASWVLYIYKVGTDPLKYGSQDCYAITVSGYPALPSRPTNTESEDYGDDVAEWASYRDYVWLPQFEAAVQSRDEALALLSSIDLTTDQFSAIQSSTSALARALPKDSNILVLSDLENNQSVSFDSTLEGSRVWIVKPYTTGDVDYQRQLETDYIDYLVNMGVTQSDIEIYAPENANAAFTAVFRE